ncbi:hypothetical protein D3C76_1439400 [compost metagenome]
MLNCSASITPVLRCSIRSFILLTARVIPAVAAARAIPTGPRAVAISAPMPPMPPRIIPAMPPTKPPLEAFAALAALAA